MLLRLYHLTVASLYWYTVWYDQNFINIPFPKGLESYPLKGRTTFLTFWCLCMQTTYFTIAVLNDYVGTNVANPKQNSILRSINDKLFILAFPTAFYVACAFWGIYAVDKDLIFPDHVAKEFPSWANHTMHTFVLIFITLELTFTYRRYPSKATGFLIVLAFNLTYTLWFHYIYFETNSWVYPIFNVLNWPARVVFITISCSIALVFYILGEKLNTLVWSKVSQQKIKSK
ncbi:hypothetical protein MSG28_002008 [Choristoneura fumiferana]|uniref:Uncharacterized protein n=1 Tax=Choristoneura fumiferana TaxID=7141 RepID=A0ACC0JTG8_CHOFU|nr:hypothetical protein MSG28_002008 [Choristoneura fumiferana]